MYTALCFGFKAAPLLMARLASLISKFLQSHLLRGEGSLQTYMDDPCSSWRAHWRGGHDPVLPVCHGRRCGVNWIGVAFEPDMQREHMRPTISQRMVKELLAKLRDWQGVGMMGLKELSGVAGILTRMRWAVSIMYGVVAAAERDARSGAEEQRAAKRSTDQRPKPDLVAVSRFEFPRAWLVKLLEQADKKEDADWLGVPWKEAASQSAPRPARAIRFWKTRLRQMPLLLEVRQRRRPRNGFET